MRKFTLKHNIRAGATANGCNIPQGTKGYLKVTPLEVIRQNISNHVCPFLFVTGEEGSQYWMSIPEMQRYIKMEQSHNNDR